MLLYDFTPDETIKKTQHVKSIMGEPEFSLFPIDSHKKIISKSEFYDIINKCKIEISKNQDINRLKANKKTINVMCEKIMEMCFEEM
jgi:hypothetical protein